MSALEERVKGVLVSEEEAKEIVERLGKQISKDYEGKNLVLVSVLKGAVVFMADLMRAIDIPLSIDFMVVSSYNKTESTGTVKIIKDLDEPIEGKDVLIVGHGAMNSSIVCQIKHLPLHDFWKAGIENCRLMRLV